MALILSDLGCPFLLLCEGIRREEIMYVGYVAWGIK